LPISNRDSFRVLSDKIASVYFVWKIYLYYSIGNDQTRKSALCQSYRHTFLRYTLACVVSGGVDSSGSVSRRLYSLCWSELSRRKLSPTLTTSTTLVLTTLVAQCELRRRKIGLLLEVVGRKFSHRPGNPATVGVVSRAFQFGQKKVSIRFDSAIW